jgi:hypothetical protein
VKADPVGAALWLVFAFGAGAVLAWFLAWHQQQQPVRWGSGCPSAVCRVQTGVDRPPASLRPSTLGPA